MQLRHEIRKEYGRDTSQDGRRVVTISRDNIVRVFDRETAELRLELFSPELLERSGALSADGERIAAVVTGGDVLVWDLRDDAGDPARREFRRLRVGSPVTSAQFEPDGALLLVTHDRLLLERVSTLILALDGEGGTAVFADYPQWEAARLAAARLPKKVAQPAPARARTRPPRLGYREQREWEGMEQAILEAEHAVEACRREAEDPSIASDSAALQARYAALQSAQAEVDRLYARWAELEAKQA